MKSLGICLVVGALAASSLAQIKLPGGKDIKIDLGGGLDNIFKPESPLSTSPKDLYEGVRTLDGFNPEFKTLTNADKRDGKFVLAPGAYRLTLHAFCGKGYAKGPSKGMGYGTAPWKGKQADIIQNLVRKYDQTNVPQEQAQLLIWSILARVKPSKMNSEMQGYLAKLLEPKDIARLEGYSLDSLSEDAMGKLQGKVDDSIRPFYEAENKFRGMMYQSTQNLEISNGSWFLWMRTCLRRSIRADGFHRPRATSIGTFPMAIRSSTSKSWYLTNLSYLEIVRAE